MSSKYQLQQNLRLIGNSSRCNLIDKIQSKIEKEENQYYNCWKRVVIKVLILIKFNCIKEKLDQDKKMIIDKIIWK